MTLKGLAAALFAAGAKVNIEVRALVEHTAGEITDDARERMAPSKHPHLPFYVDSITYDVDSALGVVRAEIGPDADLPQGKLGELLERGSADNAPVPHLGPAADDKVPGLSGEIGAVGARALR